MKLEVGENYLTKCGNTVYCFRKCDEGYWCRYLKVIDGHENLMNIEIWNNQLWSEDGSWVGFPGGIHDIIKIV